ncbi:MAG: D-sedoheptulose 7-phosphate isomerase [Gammaproteobacteria bacterium]
MRAFIHNEIKKSLAILQQISLDNSLLSTVENIVTRCVNALRSHNKILFAGNGGSAADSQHLAAELVSRLRYDRPGLAGIALTTDTSALTAIGNDYAFDNLFARQIEALGQPGDVFIGISTSGRSPNILRAFEKARSLGITTIGFTRDEAPLFSERCDYLLNIPATETPKIQECHILMGHVICAMIEEEMFGLTHNPQSAKVTA